MFPEPSFELLLAECAARPGWETPVMAPDVIAAAAAGDERSDAESDRLALAEEIVQRWRSHL